MELSEEENDRALEEYYRNPANRPPPEEGRYPFPDDPHERENLERAVKFMEEQGIAAEEAKMRRSGELAPARGLNGEFPAAPGGINAAAGSPAEAQTAGFVAGAEDGFSKRVAERTPPAGTEDIEAFMKAMKAECPGHSAGTAQALKKALEDYVRDSTGEPQLDQAVQKFRESAAESQKGKQVLTLQAGAALRSRHRH